MPASNKWLLSLARPAAWGWASPERCSNAAYRVVANSRTISKSKELKPSADLVLVDGDIGKKETAIKGG